MDSTLLIEVCVAVLGALCLTLLAYGAWLCLPIPQRRPAPDSTPPLKSDLVA